MKTYTWKFTYNPERDYVSRLCHWHDSQFSNSVGSAELGAVK